MNLGYCTRILVLAMSLLTACGRPYVLPVADYQTEPASPPTLQGRVADVAQGDLSVTVDGEPDRQARVRIRSETQMVSLYGGTFDPEELRSGQYVWVWYRTGQPVSFDEVRDAAVVMLWSTDPSDQPPDAILREHPR
ncbi:MAG: hypothetical protein ABI629_11440 [bacterium]